MFDLPWVMGCMGVVVLIVGILWGVNLWARRVSGQSAWGKMGTMGHFGLAGIEEIERTLGVRVPAGLEAAYADGRAKSVAHLVVKDAEGEEVVQRFFPLGVEQARLSFELLGDGRLAFAEDDFGNLWYVFLKRVAGGETADERVGFWSHDGGENDGEAFVRFESVGEMFRS